MKINIFDKIKGSKPFHISDLIIYISLALFIFILFAVFVLFPSESEGDGFKVTLDGKEVFLYHASTNEYEIKDIGKDFISVSQDTDGLFVKIFTDENKVAYNLLFIDVNSKTAKVTESNCSSSKDCVHTSPIKDSGVIVCAPHKLKIAPLVGDIDQPVVG